MLLPPCIGRRAGKLQGFTLAAAWRRYLTFAVTVGGVDGQLTTTGVYSPGTNVSFPPNADISGSRGCRSKPLPHAAVMAACSLAMFAKAESTVTASSTSPRRSARCVDRAMHTVSADIDVGIGTADLDHGAFCDGC